MIKDYRYKIKQEDVAIMRVLREEGNSYSSIATLFPVTQGTVAYWCNENSRNKQKLKNSKRRYEPLDKKRMARDGLKRNELQKDTKYKTRQSFQSALDEKRKARHSSIDYRVGKRLPMKKIKNILKTKELHQGNAKIN